MVREELGSRDRTRLGLLLSVRILSEGMTAQAGKLCQQHGETNRFPK